MRSPVLRQKQRGQPSPAACAMGVGEESGKIGSLLFLIVQFSNSIHGNDLECSKVGLGLATPTVQLSNNKTFYKRMSTVALLQKQI